VSDFDVRVHGEEERIEDAARKLIERGAARFNGEWLIAKREHGRIAITGDAGIPVLVSANRQSVARAIARCFSDN
jgi:hypothetical protein